MYRPTSYTRSDSIIFYAEIRRWFIGKKRGIIYIGRALRTADIKHPFQGTYTSWIIWRSCQRRSMRWHKHWLHTKYLCCLNHFFLLDDFLRVACKIVFSSSSLETAQNDWLARCLIDVHEKPIFFRWSVVRISPSRSNFYVLNLNNQEQYFFSFFIN